MTALLIAKLVVAAVPFTRWRATLACSAQRSAADYRARRLAARVERAALRLPFETKCLPRAVALSWLLRRRNIGHAVVFAVRPYRARDDTDTLHAWVEIDGTRILGDLPGPWLETLRLDAS